MRRRNFLIAPAGAAIGGPLFARAQTDRMRRIGVLHGANADNPGVQGRIAAFQEGLQQFGWIAGRNVQIDYHWGAGNPDDIQRYATEMAALAPDVILTAGNSVEQLLRATRTIPIVFVIVPDPVGAGLVDSLSRPGGNATGFTLACARNGRRC